MIPAILVGALCSLAALATTRPLWARTPAAGVSSGPTAGEADRDRMNELAQQLRDLDEDLASGKLPEADHRRLRAEVLATPVVGVSPPRRKAPAPAPRPRSLRRWALALLLVVAAGGAVSLQLRDQVEPSSAATRPAASPSATASGSQLKQAAARVRRHPKDVSAHLALAKAYAGAGQQPLSTIEYLAATRLDPANAEANTALALVVFQRGDVKQARTLITTVLAAHPRYPEALFARGVIELMGLDQPRAARRAFTAYLTEAPFGSHRADVGRLMKVIDSQTKP